jgi:hypothetical protein
MPTLQLGKLVRAECLYFQIASANGPFVAQIRFFVAAFRTGQLRQVSPEPGM